MESKAPRGSPKSQIFARPSVIPLAQWRTPIKYHAQINATRCSPQHDGHIEMHYAMSYNKFGATYIVLMKSSSLFRSRFIFLRPATVVFLLPSWILVQMSYRGNNSCHGRGRGRGGGGEYYKNKDGRGSGRSRRGQQGQLEAVNSNAGGSYADLKRALSQIILPFMTWRQALVGGGMKKLDSHFSLVAPSQILMLLRLVVV